MYKVFIDNRPIFFIDKSTPFSPGIGALNRAIGTAQELQKAIKQFEEDKLLEKMYLSVDDVPKMWGVFKGLYTYIEAAGGLVKNEEGNALFIFRNGKWDLPKGKLELGELVEEGAMREVEEECGVVNLTIVEPLPSTYHTYVMKGKSVLKRTHWFLMATQHQNNLIPQEEEGITQVIWAGAEKQEELLKNTYPSIIDVINANRPTP